MLRYSFLTLLLLLACTEDYYQDFFERAACIELPSCVSNVEHFTESDIAFTSHYTIPADSVDIFAVQLNFQSEPPEDWTEILFTEELPVPWNDISEEGIILYCTGANNWNRWDILLHTDSGSLWVTMHYTDASGDPPF